MILTFGLEMMQNFRFFKLVVFRETNQYLRLLKIRKEISKK